MTRVPSPAASGEEPSRSSSYVRHPCRPIVIYIYTTLSRFLSSDLTPERELGNKGQVIYHRAIQLYCLSSTKLNLITSTCPHSLSCHHAIIYISSIAPHVRNFYYRWQSTQSIRYRTVSSLP